MDSLPLLASQDSAGTFVEGILIILTIGLLASLLCRQWSLPPLMGYIVMGMLIGPSATGLVRTGLEDIEHAAELGVFFLLFSIGLELSLDELRRTSRYLLIGGPMQMVLVALPVATLLMLLDWPPSKAWLLGSALSFSSTVLVFKSLGELGFITTPAGRRSIAILLFQDAALVPLLLCLPMLVPVAGTSEDGGWLALLNWTYMGLVSLGFLAGTILLRIVMANITVPRIMKHRSPDLVVLLALVVLGSVTLTAYRIGLPAAIGAFAAGVVFGGNRWAEQIDSLILPFREVFSAVFFVSLGLLIDPLAIAAKPLLIGGLVIGLVLLKTTAAVVAFRFTGLKLRHALGPSLGLAHVGEFAFVLLLLASSAGILSESEKQVAMATAGGSILIAPLMIRWGFKRSYAEHLEEVEAAAVVDHHPSEQLRHAVVIGMGPVGKATASQLETLGFELACLDLNPLNLQSFAQIGVMTVAGNAEAPEVLAAAGAAEAKLILICVPVDEVAVRIAQQSRKLNPSATIVVRCRYVHTVPALRQAGANHIVNEEANAANQLVALISGV